MSKLTELLQSAGCELETWQPLPQLSERVGGFWRGHHFMIDASIGRSLMLSVGDLKGWEKALRALRPICTQFIQAEPLCQYDAKIALQWSHYMEWQLQYSEQYLRDLVNGGDGLASVQRCNFVLFGDRKLSDYEDAELRQLYAEEAALHQQFAGVYGKDPGECSLPRVRRASELGLFLEYAAALEKVTELQKHTHQGLPREDIFAAMMFGGTISELQQRLAFLSLDFLVYTICQRAGIATGEPVTTHRLTYDSKSFLRWYNFYGAHIAKLPDQDVVTLYQRHYQGEDISAFSPVGNWQG